VDPCSCCACFMIIDSEVFLLELDPDTFQT